MRIAVIALGKIGLPLAVQFAGAGHEVIGADVNEAAVASINKGIVPFPGEYDLDRLLPEVIAAGRFQATTDTAGAVSQADAVVVVVPLFVDSDGVPDFAAMDSATRAIAGGLKPGALVSYETTLPVGTTRTRFGPMLEAGSGLRVSEDFWLIFSPERVLTGRVFADLRRYPKLVGGVDPHSGAKGVEFYSQVLEFDERPDLDRANGAWDLGSAEASEMAKLAETTYRDVNIGLANQFARFADQHGFDITEVIAASNSQPYSHIHSPVFAVGGPCIPIYPRFYLWNDPAATIVKAARDANEGMPSYAVDLLEGAYGNLGGARVVVLGASYRGGVKETAFSGVFPTVAALEKRGAQVSVHDPMYTDDELVQLGFTPFHLGDSADAAILQADHESYRALAPADISGVRVLVDGRRVTNADSWTNVDRLEIGAPPRIGSAQ